MISNLFKTFDYDIKCIIKDKPIETDCIKRNFDYLTIKLHKVY